LAGLMIRYSSSRIPMARSWAADGGWGSRAPALTFIGWLDARRPSRFGRLRSLCSKSAPVSNC
jgi:hypothetical protein